MDIGSGAAGDVRLFDGVDYAAIRNLADSQEGTTAEWLGVMSALFGYDGATWSRIHAVLSGDTLAGTAQSLATIPYTAHYNGSQWERTRGAVESNLLPAAARESTPSIPDQTNYNHRGLHLFAYVSAVSGTSPTLDISIRRRALTEGSGWEWQDDGSNIEAPQITGAKEVQIDVYPGLTKDITGDIRTYNQIPPRTIQIRNIIGGTTPSFTYSLDLGWHL